MSPSNSRSIPLVSPSTYKFTRIGAHGGRLWVSPGGPHGVFQFSLPVDHRVSEGEDAREL
jgi:hypothetical protein